MLGDRWCNKTEIVQCVLLWVLQREVGVVYSVTQTHSKKKRNICLLTVQPNIMVGQNSWLVALGSATDHHVQHPIRGFNVMFLKHKNNYFSKEPEKLSGRI